MEKSISKVKDQWSKQVNPQEINWFLGTKPNEDRGCRWRDHLQQFKMLDPDEQFRTICESAGFIRPVSVGMYYRTSDDMTNGFGNLTASRQRVYTTSCSSRFFLWSSSGKDIQWSDQFLKSRLYVIFMFMESRFRSPLHLETTPMFGWSYPEARTATWMSCDTRIQNILQEALKKLTMEACWKLMWNNRLFNRDLKAVHLLTSFR